MAKGKKEVVTEEGVELVVDRELALLMASFDKDFGKGAVFNGMSAPLSIPVISSGSLKLNLALGVGGYPRGRIIEVVGGESAGKCLTLDTYIRTSSGWQTIAEIFVENDVAPFCVHKDTPKVVSLVNRYGELEETLAFTNNGRATVLETRTFSGARVKSTARHPHLVLSPGGYEIWKATEDLEIGDYLISERESANFGSFSLDPDLAYFLGVIIADAYCGENRVSITNDDPCVKDVITSQGPVLFHLSPNIYENNDEGSLSFHFNSKEFVTKLYEWLNWGPGIAKDKKFGSVLRKADKDTLRAIVGGYVDCECSIEKEGRCLEVSSASQELLTELKLILQQFGIISLVRDKSVKVYPDNDYFKLTISGQELLKYNEIIGLRSKSRQAEMLELFPRIQCQTNFDSIPNMGPLLKDLFGSTETDRNDHGLMSDYMGVSPRANLTYDRLGRIIEAFDGRGNPDILSRLRKLYSEHKFFDRVESLERLLPEPTFDFAMSRTHSFQANGLITHNTTLTLHAIAEAQAAGELAGFIDVEHALDIKYAKNLGVNTNRLIVSQPTTGEEALQIADRMIRSGKFAIVVIDSVAALVPKAELEGDIGDSHVGLQSRLMSQALRVMVGAAEKTGTVVLFVNQYRQKIGISFGDPRVPCGGGSLKYYASQRLDVARASVAKDGDGEAKNIVSRIKVIKNKVASPFREAEIDIMFGTGINIVAEILDLSVEHGIVEKAGAWYSYEKERIGQGRDNTIKFLETYSKLDEIEKRLNGILFKDRNVTLEKVKDPIAELVELTDIGDDPLGAF